MTVKEADQQEATVDAPKDTPLNSPKPDEVSGGDETNSDSGLAKSDGPLKMAAAAEPKGFWEHAEKTAKIVAGLGTATAAIIAALQYQAANAGIRSERSLSFVQLWQEQEVDREFAAVQVFVEGQLKTVETDLSVLDELSLKHALNNLGRTWLIENRNSPTPDDIETHLDNLTLFFSQIEICIEAKLCDPDVLQSYFYSEVDSLWGYFSHYAVLRRDEGYRDYGSAVERLVKKFSGSNK